MKAIDSVLHFPGFVLGLIAQLVAMALFAPWNAPAGEEFYIQAKWAIVVGLLVHVFVRIAHARWRRSRSARLGPMTARSWSNNPWVLAILSWVGAMLIALACASAADAGFFGVTTAMVVCMFAQQVGFVSAVFEIRRSSVSRASNPIAKLIAVSLFASYFSAVVPALFYQISTGVQVAIDARNLVFAVPTILASVVTTYQYFRRSL